MIEKYINIAYYEFQQDFTGILEKNNINKKYINFINEYLKTKIDGNILSIRQLEKNIESFENINNECEISYLKIIFNFWSNNSKAKMIILKKLTQLKIDLNLAFNKINEIKLILNELIYPNETNSGQNKIYLSFSKILEIVDEKLWQDFNYIAFQDIELESKISKIIFLKNNIKNMQNDIVEIWKNTKEKIKLSNNNEKDINWLINELNNQENMTKYNEIISKIFSLLKKIKISIDNLLENNDSKEIIESLENTNLNKFNKLVFEIINERKSIF